MDLLKVPFCADIMPNSLAVMVVCAHFHELFVAINPIVFRNIPFQEEIMKKKMPEGFLYVGR